MGTLQKIITSLFPQKIAKKIEDESKAWFMECPRCGYAISYWDAGGVRAYAKSIGKRVWGRCKQCRKFVFFKVRKKQEG